MKASKNIYRNLNGYRFIHVTSNPSEFDNLKKECKKEGIKFRIINGDFLKQSKI